MSLAAKGRTFSTETRAKMRAAKLGKPGPWLGVKRGPQSASWRANIARGNLGKPAYYPMRRYHYGGAAFRSSWELELAKAFDERGIEWRFEPRKFDLGSQTYTPDFYLPQQECFIEVKGYFGPQSKATVELFRERNPEIPLIVATKEVLKMMGVTKFRHMAGA